MPGFTDKMATEQRAAELERQAAREQSGLIDRYASHRARPLIEHLADWHESLAVDNTQEYADQKHSRTLRVINGCKFRFWPEISAFKAQTFIANLGKGPKGLSTQTRNQYLGGQGVREVDGPGWPSRREPGCPSQRGQPEERPAPHPTGVHGR